MGICLGNLTVENFIKRTGWQFTDNEIKWLNNHRQDNATVRSYSDKFHIFDIPFQIDCSPSISDELMKMLRNKDAETSLSEPLTISVVRETEEERIEKKQREEKLRLEEEQADESIKWLYKHMISVPIGDGRMYHAFINTECYGYHNHGEPRGNFWIMKDEEGLHGRFFLDNPEINKTEHPEWNYVIGLGVYNADGYLLNNQNEMFSRIEGRLENCLCGCAGAIRLN